MSQKDNLLGVVETLFRWQKQILYTCLIAGIGAILISLFLSNYYLSTTVFLAASPDVSKPEQIFGTSSKDMEYYGTENDIDRILTIAESNDLVNYLVEKFSLYEHYDVDSTLQKASFKVAQKFNKRFEIEKTKRDAIELSFEDKDPEFAAMLVNDARDKIDAVARQLIKDSQQRLITTLQSSMKEKVKQLDVVNDSLMAARARYGIYNTLTQSESLSSMVTSVNSKLIRKRARLEALQESNKASLRDTVAMLRAEVKGIEQESENLKKELQLFSEGYGKVQVLETEQEEASQQISEDRERLKQVEAALNSDIAAIILVEKAQVPVVKSKPKRTIIVLAAVFIAFFFSLLAILLIENYKDVNWRRIVRGEQESTIKTI